MGIHSTTISASVRDAKGSPVVGARIFFIAGPVSMPDIAALTDEAGDCTVSVPIAGKYRIGCVAEEFELAEVDTVVTLGAKNQFEIVLK